MRDKCVVCERPTDDGQTDYCIFHQHAYSQVKSKYEAWKEALGDISWERYLERIIGLKDTGDWSREVAKYLLRSKA